MPSPPSPLGQTPTAILGISFLLVALWLASRASSSIGQFFAASQDAGAGSSDSTALAKSRATMASEGIAGAVAGLAALVAAAVGLPMLLRPSKAPWFASW